MSDRITKSGIDTRDVRRVQKANGIKYTAALRILESLERENRKAYIEAQEEKNRDGRL